MSVHPPWRGPALDTWMPALLAKQETAGKDQQQTSLQDATGRQLHGPWSPFNAQSQVFQTASVIRLASSHRESLAALPQEAPHIERPRPLSAWSSHDCILRVQGATCSSRAHHWPPHFSLSRTGRPLSGPPAPRPSVHPCPKLRIRASLRDWKTTTVHGLPRVASAGAFHQRPQTARAKDYVSPRILPSTYGLHSTHAGVGRAGFWRP